MSIAPAAGRQAARTGAPTVTVASAQPAPAPDRTPSRRTPTAAVRAWLAGTPGQLRVLTAVVVVVAVGFGLAAAQAFRSTAAALDRADANTAQLLRVQAIAVDLVRADATATNSFLVGGLEPPEQRTEYLTALDDATSLIARAATAQPADADALSRLNTVVTRYAGLVEQARANNRQNLQVGAQYLREASASLRGEALPILDAMATANSERIDAELDAVNGTSTLLTALGVLAVVVLVAGSIWLALRSRRYVNLGLATTLAVVLVVLAVGMLTLSAVASRVEAVADDELKSTKNLGTARVAAFDARSNESLTLIARGSGQAFEQAWQEASKTVESSASELRAQWEPYATSHAAIRELDDAGRWEDAVDAATDTQGESATAFAEFDRASRERLDEQSQAASDGLRDSLGWLPWVGWACLVAGVGAAVAGWRGVGQRLEEYR
jgi:hypothetical protein